MPQVYKNFLKGDKKKEATMRQEKFNVFSTHFGEW